MRDDNKDYMMIEEISLVHPVLDTFLPQRNGIADAFDYIGQARAIDAKYGDAAGDVKELHNEVLRVMEHAAKATEDEVAAQ